MDDLDRLALRFPCGYCGASPDEWCVTASGAAPGRRARWLHEARRWPIGEAHHLGWGRGYGVAVEMIAQRVKARRDGEHWACDFPWLDEDASLRLERWLRQVLDRRSPP